MHCQRRTDPAIDDALRHHITLRVRPATHTTANAGPPRPLGPRFSPFCRRSSERTNERRMNYDHVTRRRAYRQNAALRRREARVPRCPDVYCSTIGRQGEGPSEGGNDGPADGRGGGWQRGFILTTRPLRIINAPTTQITYSRARSASVT